jgi:hypothetical protein
VNRVLAGLLQEPQMCMNNLNKWLNRFFNIQQSGLVIVILAIGVVPRLKSMLCLTKWRNPAAAYC